LTSGTHLQNWIKFEVNITQLYRQEFLPAAPFAIHLFFIVIILLVATVKSCGSSASNCLFQVLLAMTQPAIIHRQFLF
jgi:hypothetical protein